MNKEQIEKKIQDLKNESANASLSIYRSVEERRNMLQGEEQLKIENLIRVGRTEELEERLKESIKKKGK